MFFNNAFVLAAAMSATDYWELEKSHLWYNP